MEEVVGSIPTRSTKSPNNLGRPAARKLLRATSMSLPRYSLKPPWLGERCQNVRTNLSIDCQVFRIQSDFSKAEFLQQSQAASVFWNHIRLESPQIQLLERIANDCRQAFQH